MPRTARPPAPAPVAEDLYDQPGHLIRRAHQISQAMFGTLVGTQVTPLQYAILRMVHEVPGIDQVGLARRIALDTSTTATTVVRLAQKGLLARTHGDHNQRKWQLHLTAEGEGLLGGLVDGVHRMRTELLDALEPAERELFMRLLQKFVRLNNEQSRAPLQISTTQADTAATSAKTTRRRAAT